MTLRAEFVHSASPEAIQAELEKAQAAARKADRRVRELAKLLSMRYMERQQGRWPYCGDEADSLLIPPQRCTLPPGHDGDHQGTHGESWDAAR